MDTTDLKSALAGVMKGEVSDDAETLKKLSRDTSLLTRTPQLVVYPEDAADVSAIVKKVAALRQFDGLTAGKDQGERADLSVTARSAGTDMSGGPLTTSVVVSFTEHMNHMGEVAVSSRQNAGVYAITEPGEDYRDFEKATMGKGLLFPSYPASRE